MEVSARVEKGRSVVTVKGRLDAVTAPEFEKQCAHWIDEGQHRMVIDFSGLEYISSAGLRSILAAARKLKSLGGALALSGLTGVVKEVFTISGFDAILPTFDSVEKAVDGI